MSSSVVQIRVPSRIHAMGLTGESEVATLPGLDSGRAPREDGRVTTQSAEEMEATLRQHAVGRTVRALQILGINSLKTVEPSPAALEGHIVVDVAAQGRALEIAFETCAIHVDLARTGRIKWLPTAEAWTPTDATQAPTLRLLLGDGSAVDFTEPARTKRISASIRSRG